MVALAQILWAQWQPARVMVKVQAVFRKQVATQGLKMEAGLVEGKPFTAIQAMLKPLVQLRQALQDESGTLLAFLGIQGVQVEHLGFQHQRVGGSEQLRQGGLHCELVLVTQQKGRRQAQLFEALTADTEAQVLDRAGDLRTLGARRRTGGTLATQWRNRALNPLELLLQAFGGLDVAQTEAQIANAPREIQGQLPSVVQWDAVERPANFAAHGRKALLQEAGQDQPEGQAICVVAVQVMREMDHGVQPRRNWKFARNFQTRFEPLDQLSLKNQRLNDVIGGPGGFEPIHDLAHYDANFR